MGSYRAKYILFELKKNTGTNIHETEEDTKFGQESTYSVKNGIKNLTKSNPSAGKSQEFSF